MARSRVITPRHNLTEEEAREFLQAPLLSPTESAITMPDPIPVAPLNERVAEVMRGAMDAIGYTAGRGTPRPPNAIELRSGNLIIRSGGSMHRTFILFRVRIELSDANSERMYRHIPSGIAFNHHILEYFIDDQLLDLVARLNRGYPRSAIMLNEAEELPDWAGELMNIDSDPRRGAAMRGDRPRQVIYDDIPDASPRVPSAPGGIPSAPGQVRMYSAETQWSAEDLARMAATLRTGAEVKEERESDKPELIDEKPPVMELDKYEKIVGLYP